MMTGHHELLSAVLTLRRHTMAYVDARMPLKEAILLLARERALRY